MLGLMILLMILLVLDVGVIGVFEYILRQESPHMSKRQRWVFSTSTHLVFGFVAALMTQSIFPFPFVMAVMVWSSMFLPAMAMLFLTYFYGSMVYEATTRLIERHITHKHMYR